MDGIVEGLTAALRQDAAAIGVIHNVHMTSPSLNDADVHGHIGALWIYPIKSCAGIAMTRARLLPTGLEWDRAWMVVDAKGQFLTQRRAARMALIVPQIDEAAGLLRITAPGMPALSVSLELPWMSNALQRRVQVWRSQVMAWDMGDEASQWFSQFLGLECHLVRYDPAQPRYSNTKWTAGIQAPNQFADGYPLLVTTQAAVDDLNQRLTQQGHAAVSALRFRPNVVLHGLAAHEEDFIEHLWISAEGGNTVRLHLGKPCERCPIPNIDPATAISHPAVGDTLQQYRQDARLQGAITFGMNAVVAQGAGSWLAVGQAAAGAMRFD